MELPLFPLHAVLFPGRPLPLHVFEPRYRLMLADLIEGDGRFGVVAIRQGREVGGDAELYEVGTVARLVDVQPLPDGRSDVLTRGEQRFRLVEILHDRPYPFGRVEPLDDPAPAADLGALATLLRRHLGPYLCALGAPEELLEHLPADPAELAYLAAASLQTELPEQQRLLELQRPEHRLAAVLQLLRREHGLSRHLGTVGSLRPPGPGGCQLN